MVLPPHRKKIPGSVSGQTWVCMHMAYSAWVCVAFLLWFPLKEAPKSCMFGPTGDKELPFGLSVRVNGVCTPGQAEFPGFNLRVLEIRRNLP